VNHTQTLLRATILATTTTLLIACGGDASNDDPPIVIIEEEMGGQQPDMGGQQADMPSGTDMSQEEDIPTFGDVDLPDSEMGAGCQNRTLVSRGWPLHTRVSTGAVNVTEEAGVWTAVIDASAGGSMASRNNPFVYLDLDNGGAKVEITDMASLDDTRWELAFKRVVIRTNSGDSGVGDTQLAKELDTTFETAPAPDPSNASLWAIDETVDEECELLTDPIGNLNTAFNEVNLFNRSGSRSWYQYGGGGAGGVAPTPGDVYFVKSADTDAIYKVEITAWTSGTFTIRWAKLP
jgi:hypothetical protein